MEPDARSTYLQETNKRTPTLCWSMKPVACSLPCSANISPSDETPILKQDDGHRQKVSVIAAAAPSLIPSRFQYQCL